MELFDITKTMFEQHKNWVNVTNLEKRKNFFMINRFASIGYPLQAHLLQHIKINPIYTMDYLFLFLSSKHNKTPHWMFIKGAKKKKEVKEKTADISNSLLNEYANYRNIPIKIIKDALKFFPDDTIKEIKTYEKMMKER